MLGLEYTELFLKKCCTIDAWQDSEYSSGSDYGRVTKGSEYTRVTQGSQQNPLLLDIIDIWQSSEYASILKY